MVVLTIVFPTKAPGPSTYPQAPGIRGTEVPVISAKVLRIILGNSGLIRRVVWCKP